jgi:hypothetical protein
MTAWASMYTATGLMYVEDDDGVVAPDTAATVAAVGDTGITGEPWDAPSFALVRSLARAAGDAFYPGTFVTPFGLDEGPLMSAMPRTFDNDDPSLREAAAMHGRDREEWQQACDDEHDNLINHDAFEYVPEDSLPSWNPRANRAREVCDTLWVLKQKRDGKNEKTKKKGRICYNGAMQKATAAHNGRVIETFAPTVRHTTFKLLAAHGAVTGRRCRHFDVEGAYLKGKFEDGEVVYARPPPNFPGGTVYRLYDEREVPLVWRLKVPLYGEADAGRIWNCTAVNQLVNVQGFTQSEYDPCYFFKEQGGERVDIALYVDDGYVLG